MTQSNFSDETETKTEVAKIDLAIEEPGNITVTTPQTAQFQQVKDQVITVVSELPELVSNFFTEYQKPLINVGLVVGGAIGIKLLLAVLDALNDIPLLAPTFELIGIGYTAWFVYRYLLQESTRQELLAEIESFKDQIVGKKS
ncbi:MAG: CAAD domain-containing protein [Oscillatoriaceae cyanobacterium Prado104]|jgi:glutamyl-tRNA synthetase|nr:CAAD domain-containing protein [Oscillatoriaceae cyanobacterium Prado104]